VVFEAWLRAVDKWLLRFGSCDHQAIGEYPWREWFDRGISPKTAAYEVWRTTMSCRCKP
jgi:hypothetical protein